MVGKNKREKHDAISYKDSHSNVTQKPRHKSISKCETHGYMSYKNAETGYVGQVVERLPSMHKVLSLIPSTQ